MKRVLGWLLMAVAVFLVMAGLAAAPLIFGIGEHRRACGRYYDSIEAALAPFDILDAAPAGVTSDGERDRDCTDTDDHHATISRFYRTSGQHGSRENIESFYRDLALRNGWKLSSGGDPAAEPRCVVKEEPMGAEVSLEVWFDPESKDTSYIVSASTWPC
ncbi:hypothetical protein ACFY3V_33155 [Streptosporangium sp. NPDC000095]|uniref:hypothetical protein n=1 Tax=Streptosporangium sp. NPDC000095 TaxID=3366184 RepID=UPI003681DF68